ncbi:MAG: hypothetical protein EAX95_12470 [Candidatus Thorarchaeota archaeon]|nr:hypothetical protein [Candidatus Thorarchaeota archaeon]
MMGFVFIGIELAVLSLAVILVFKSNTFLKHRRLGLGFFLVAITLLFLFIQAPGENGIDPGSNIAEFNSSVSSYPYTVEPEPWFAPRVRIQCSYRMTIVETTRVTVGFYKGSTLIDSTVVTIESTSWSVKTEYGYESINIAPDDYTIRVSTNTGRRVDVKLTQDQAEGRDEFQIAYDTFKLYALYGAVGFALILYLVRNKRIGFLDPHRMPAVNPETSWN